MSMQAGGVKSRVQVECDSDGIRPPHGTRACVGGRASTDGHTELLGSLQGLVVLSYDPRGLASPHSRDIFPWLALSRKWIGGRATTPP